MSVPARQTKNVDLIRDDPERLLDVTEAAALLHVKEQDTVRLGLAQQNSLSQDLLALTISSWRIDRMGERPTTKFLESNTKVSNRGRVALLLSDGC